MIGAYGVGTDLSGNIHLDGAVDGGNLGISSNDRSIINVGNIQHCYHRVIINKVIQVPASHHETGYNFFRVFCFFLACDHAAFNQVYYTVAEHLGVNTEVFMVAQRFQYRIRYSPDSHLQRSPVFYQLRAVVTYLLFNLIGFGYVELMQRLVCFNKRVETAGMEDTVAMGSRHIGIDQGNGFLC